MTDRFILIFAKVERAKKHIDDLHGALDAFWQTKPYSTRLEDDPNTGERTYYLVSVQDVPFEIVTIVGDVLHNLRSALDHLAYQLVLSAGNTPSTRTSFPIAKSAAEYMSPSFRGKIKGMRKRAIDAIDASKPYKGGNDTLWRLHKLNNIDKHRLLITACSMNSARSMTPSERAAMTKILVGSHPGELVPELGHTFKAITPIIPLKAGDKLHTAPRCELQQDMKFLIDVAFNEPQVIQGKPLIEALHEMAKLVGKTVLEFDDFLV